MARIIYFLGRVLTRGASGNGGAIVVIMPSVGRLRGRRGEEGGETSRTMGKSDWATSQIQSGRAATWRHVFACLDSVFVRYTWPCLCSFVILDMSLDAYQLLLDAAALDAQLRADIAVAAVTLRARGCGVVPNVVTAQECDAWHDQFWDVMQGASKGRLTRPHSAADLRDFKATCNWAPNRHGIFEDGAWAHLPLTYEVRTHPRVVVAFARLYGTGQHMVISADRINYQMPAEWLPRAKLGVVPKDPADIGRVDEASWLHIDQAMTKSGLYCIQGLVTLTDVTQPGDASLELVPGTHLLHDGLAADLGVTDRAKLRTDWHMFSDEEKATLHDKYKQRERGLFAKFQSVKASKGSLLLWDSRCWHQGGRIRAHALRPRPIPTPRFVVYVCMQPAVHAELSDTEIMKRRAMFQEKKAMAHWPLKAKVFGPPRTYGQPRAAFDFQEFVGDDQAPVIQALFGLTRTRDSPLDALRARPAPPLLFFAPESGVNLAHPPPLPPPKVKAKRIRAAKRKAEDVIDAPAKRIHV